MSASAPTVASLAFAVLERDIERKIAAGSNAAAAELCRQYLDTSARDKTPLDHDDGDAAGPAADAAAAAARSDDDSGDDDSLTTSSPVAERRNRISLLYAGTLSKLKQWGAVREVISGLPRPFVDGRIDALLLEGLAGLAANCVADAVRCFRAVLVMDPAQPLARTSMMAIRQHAQKKKAHSRQPEGGSPPAQADAAAACAGASASEAAVSGTGPGGGRTPVVIISGFLGAGKTTFLNHVLANREGLRAAVVVNDMASVNVDAGLVLEAVHQQRWPQQQKPQQLQQPPETQKAATGYGSSPALALPAAGQHGAVVPELVELSNGCICCTLRDDLARQLADLATRRVAAGLPRAGEKQFDYIFVEASGISEPLPVAQIFLLPLGGHHSHNPGGRGATGHDGHGHSHGGGGARQHGHARSDDADRSVVVATGERGDDGGAVHVLNDVAYVDALVSVVDALHFWTDFASRDRLRDRDLHAAPGDGRAVVELLTAQVEYADVVVLNKCDLVPPSKAAELQAFLRRLNPTARFVETTFSRVPLAQVLFTGAFDFSAAVRSPGWLRDLIGDHESEADTFGFASWVYRCARPFVARRFRGIVAGGGSAGNGGDGGGGPSDGDIGTKAAHSASGAHAQQQHHQQQHHQQNPPAPAAATRPANIFSGVLRSKGRFALAEEPDARWIWSSEFSTRTVRRVATVATAGGGVGGGGGGAGRAAVTELVFIGIRMDEERLRVALDSAVATDAELSAYATMPAPIDHPWRRVSGSTTPTSVVVNTLASAVVPLGGGE